MVVKTKNVIKSMKKRKSINKNKRKSKKINMKGGNKFNSGPSKFNSGYVPPKSKINPGAVFNAAKTLPRSPNPSFNSLKRPKVTIPTNIESNLRTLNVSNSNTLKIFQMTGSPGSRSSRSSINSTGSIKSKESGYSSGSEPPSPTSKLSITNSASNEEQSFIKSLALKRRQKEENERIKRETERRKQENPAYQDPTYGDTLRVNATALRRGPTYATAPTGYKEPNIYATLIKGEDKKMTLNPL
jgi:hypothetical protein